MSLTRSFHLEHGHVDAHGACHRDGVLRAATARDEMAVLGDFRVYLRSDAFVDVALARTLVRLGTLESVDVGLVERLPAADRERLEDLYRELNGYPARGGES